MFPEGPNPYKLQTKPKGSSNLPLVLIHDGSGMTAGFWGLSSLGRDLWVIHNPHFWSEDPWEGGMDEMANHYLDLILAAGISGKILLGGWSLGGYISIAIARKLAEDKLATIKISGLMIIDIPYHTPWYDNRPAIVSRPKLDESVPPRVQRLLDYCDVLLHEWPVPFWDGNFNDNMDVQFTVDGNQYQVEPGTVLYKPLEGEWKSKVLPNPESLSNRSKPKNPRRPVLPPPGVLLRCINYTPTEQEGKKCHIDLFREEPVLGWEKGYPSFLKAVMEMKKDHYSLFDTTNPEQMKHVTANINSGLEILESLEVLYD